MNTVKEKNRQVAVLFWCIYLFVSHPELNSKRQKRRPLRQISARLQAVPCVICLQWFVSKRLFSYPVVELGREVEFAIAEMACVSRNVRRTFHVPFLLFQILRTVKDFPTFHFWARCLTSRSGLLTFFSSLVIQECLINFAGERQRSKKSSHCELFFVFCLSA